MPGDTDPGGESVLPCGDALHLLGAGRNRLGDGAALLPEFALGTSPAPVQPAPWGLEKSLSAAKRFMQLAIGRPLGLPAKGGLRRAGQVSGGFHVSAKHREQEVSMQASSVLLEIMQNFLSPCPGIFSWH